MGIRRFIRRLWGYKRSIGGVKEVYRGYKRSIEMCKEVYREVYKEVYRRFIFIRRLVWRGL